MKKIIFNCINSIVILGFVLGLVFLLQRRSAGVYSFLVFGRYSLLYSCLISIFLLLFLIYIVVLLKKKVLLEKLFFLAVPFFIISLLIGNYVLEILNKLNLIGAYRCNILNIYEESKDERPYWMIPNNQAYWFGKEFHCQMNINDFGLREEKNIKEILSYPYKVMFLGDSFTFGYGVAFGERYSDLLNKKLLKDNAISFTTAYACGNCPVDYEVYVRKYLDYFDPEIVVLGLFLGNDMVGDLKERELIKNDAGEIVASKLKELEVVDGFIVSKKERDNEAVGKNMRMKMFFWDKFILVRMISNIKNILLSRLTSCQLHTLHKQYEYFLGKFDAPEYAESLGAVKRIKDFVESRDKQFILFIIPSNFQISDRYFSNYQYKQDPLEPQNQIVNWCNENNIKYIDPTKKFIAKEKQGVYSYYLYDAHWNKQGHEIAADLLEDFIRQDSEIFDSKYMN